MIRKVYLKSMGIIISAAHLIWLIRNYYDGTSDIKIEEKSNFQIYHSFYCLQSTTSFLQSQNLSLQLSPSLYLKFNSGSEYHQKNRCSRREGSLNHQ